MKSSDETVAATPDQPQRAPVVPDERIVSLDYIRGIAVLGILFANITAFAHPMLAYFWPDALPGGNTRGDDAVFLFQYVFIDGKLRGLFTLLFGVGMMLFLERAWERGSGRWLQARRLFWLLLFGVLHFVLLFRGDILTSYAVWGFAALGLARARVATLLPIALIIYGLGALLLLSTGFQAFIEASPGACTPELAAMCEQLEATKASMLANAQAAREVYPTGSYLDILAFTLSDQMDTLGKGVGYGILETFPLMLLGMATYKAGWFDGRMDRATLLRWGWTGVITGTLATVPFGVWAVAADYPFYLTQFLFNGPPMIVRLPVVLGALALLAVYGARLKGLFLGERLAAAGRMAFSNYIGTSVVMMAIFNGWGLGLYGELHRPALLLFVLLGWALMLLWSKPWLERFRYGPLEWLWRCLTYWKLFPLRR